MCAVVNQEGEKAYAPVEQLSAPAEETETTAFEPIKLEPTHLKPVLVNVVVVMVPPLEVQVLPEAIFVFAVMVGTAPTPDTT